MIGALALAVTLAAYVASLRLRAYHRAAYTTPVLVSVALVLAALAAIRLPLESYESGQRPLTSLLVPACAALGVTCYRQRVFLWANGRAIAGALAVGTTVAIGSAYLLSRSVGLPRAIADVEALKSVTTPVAIQLAAVVNVEPELVVAFVIATGMTGATLGPLVLSMLRVKDAIARGVALGTISHGIGTAQAASESDVSGAASSLAMCVVAVVLATLGAPLLAAMHR
ncbi:MAG: LrgB family protein [Vulcanimicrobiaceae bacterium]